jgi:hypothetical protein
VAIGNISGVGGEHKFHFKEIPERWFKADLQEALSSNTTLMYPNEDVGHKIMGDVAGTAVIWDQKHIKIAS